MKSKPPKLYETPHAEIGHLYTTREGDVVQCIEDEKGVSDFNCKRCCFVPDFCMDDYTGSCTLFMRNDKKTIAFVKREDFKNET